MTRPCSRLVVGFFLIVVATLVVQAQQSTRKSFPFRGQVEKVDAAGNLVTVAHDSVPGLNMGPMTMGFPLAGDSQAMLKQLKPGDFIVATLYEGDSKLYGVRLDSTRVGSELPPISYVCRTPGEERQVSDAPGRCEKSGQPLVPVRITRIYSCVKHPAVRNERPGRCALDGRDLGPIDAELYFTCPPDRTRSLDPGKCPSGDAPAKVYELRPHGDHNARHGGSMIFMSSDDDHVEGTFVAPGIFRIYLYDLKTEPLAPTGVVARVALANSNAVAIGPFVPLTHVASSPMNSLEAPLPGVKMPFQVTLFVRFKPGAKEHRFDLPFNAYSEEP